MAATSVVGEAALDVLIIGGGPVGLTIAYGLQTMGISSIVVERDDKASMPMYGRACTLYPRTIEMLDQYGLLDEMNQVGFIARSSATFDANGKRVTTRGWHTMFTQMGNTFLDYVLNIRLKYSEEVIQHAYVKAGGQMLVQWELTGVQIGDSSVTASMRNVVDKSTRSIQR